MQQRFSLLLLAAPLGYFLALVIAAGPVTSRPNAIIAPNDDIPKQPSQVKVYRTSVTVILDKYQPVRRIDEVRYLHIANTAQYSIIKSILAAPGDPTIHTPNLLWRLGAPYITSNTREFKMTWEILAHALQGIQDFYSNYGVMQLTARVLEDSLGYVGDLQVGVGYQGPGNLTATE
ncbi:MAG: hypothetical protein Q9222_006678 [Ikaeria aurantiellina]